MLFHQSLLSTTCLFNMSSERHRMLFSLADFSSWTRLPSCEEAWGHPLSPAANKQPVTKAGRSVSTEIPTTFGTRHSFWHSWGNFRWDWGKICYSIDHYLPWGVFYTSHWKGIEFDNKTLRATYMYVQHIAGRENSDDMSVAKEICSTVIQKWITEIR